MDILHRLQQLLGMVQDVVLVVSSSGTVAYASASIQCVLDVDPQSLVNRSILELNHPEDALQLRSSLAQLARLQQQLHDADADAGADADADADNNEPPLTPAVPASRLHCLRFRHQWGSDYRIMLVKCQPLGLRSAAQLTADNGAAYLTHQLLGGFRGSGHVPLPQLKIASTVKDKARGASPEIVSPASPEPTPDPDAVPPQYPPKTAAAVGNGNGAASSTSPTTSAGSTGGSPGLRDDLFLLVARPYPLPPHDTALDELIQLKIENERLRATLAAKYAASGTRAAVAPPVGSVLREVAYDELLVVSSRNRQQQQRSLAPCRTESEVDVGGAGAGDSLDGTGNQLDRMDIDDMSPLTSPALAAVAGARTGSQQYLPAVGHGSGLAGVITPSDFIDANMIAASTQGKQINRKRTRRSKQAEANAEGMVCMDCGRTNSPEWRKGPTGEKCLCNACGLRYAKRKKTEKAEALGTSLPVNNPAMLRLQQQIAAAAAAAAALAASAPPGADAGDNDDDDGEPMVTGPTSATSPPHFTTSSGPSSPSYLAMSPPTTSPPTSAVPLPPPSTSGHATRGGSKQRATRPAGNSTTTRRAHPSPPLALYKPASAALDHPALHLQSRITPASDQQMLDASDPMLMSPTSQRQPSSPPFQAPPSVTSIPPQYIHMYSGAGPPPWGSGSGSGQDASLPLASAYGSPPSRSMSASLGRVPNSGSSAGSYTSRYLAREPPSRGGSVGGAAPGFSASSSSSEMGGGFGLPAAAFGGTGGVPKSGTTSGSSANNESPFQQLHHQYVQPPAMVGRTPSSVAASPPSSYSVDWAYAFGNSGAAGPPGAASGGGSLPGMPQMQMAGGPSGWEGSLFDDFDTTQMDAPLGQGLMPLNGSRLWSTPSTRQQQQMAALFQQVMHSPPPVPPQPHQFLQQQQRQLASGPPSRRSHSVASSQDGQVGDPPRHASGYPHQMPVSMRGRAPVMSAGARGGSRTGTPDYFGGHHARAASRRPSRHPSPAAAYGHFDRNLCPSPVPLSIPPPTTGGPSHGHGHGGPAGPFDTFSPASYMAAATAAAAATANQQYPPQSYYSPQHPPSTLSASEQGHHRASFMVAAAGVPQSYVSGPRPTAAQVEHMAAFMDHIRNEQMQMYQAGLSPTWASARGNGRGSSVGSGRFEQGYE